MALKQGGFKYWLIQYEGKLKELLESFWNSALTILENTSFIIGNSKNQMGMLMAFRFQIYLINCHIFWHSFILFFIYLQENWILTRFFFLWNWYLHYPEAKQNDYFFLSPPPKSIYSRFVFLNTNQNFAFSFSIRELASRINFGCLKSELPNHFILAKLSSEVQYLLVF